ncbi:hypothetical protein D0868_15189 [Hortaea werneckii]|uniref:Fe2OG dioxygenase domain-containing protein n=1 Tax=Hortaea werneckii TaxID=91943 RepID=A0A3M6X5Z8_HORWE|nr:hypothetical protein D0868_15189 [Hortaea werneckii]
MQEEKEKNEMEQYRIADAPASIYYIPNFITPEEERHLLESVRVKSSSEPLQGPEDFSDSPHGGANHCLINEYHPGQGIMPHEDGAAYHPVVATVSLNGSLVLEITPKTASSSPAEDQTSSPEDPTSSSPTGEKTPNPPPPRKTPWRILQEPRSLLLTTEPAYSTTLHGIPSVHADTELTSSTVANWDQLSSSTREKIAADGDRNERATTRISLTFRDVRKVSSLGMKVFGKVRT